MPAYWLMAPSSELLADLFQLGPQFLGDGLATYREAPVAPAFRTVVGEAEEVEGFRLPLAPLFAVCGGEAPELDEPGLPFVQFEAEALEPLLQIFLKPLRVGSVLESHDEVIRVPHDIDFAPCMARAPLLHPQIQYVVQ